MVHLHIYIRSVSDSVHRNTGGENRGSVRNRISKSAHQLQKGLHKISRIFGKLHITVKLQCVSNHNRATKQLEICLKLVTLVI